MLMLLKFNEKEQQIIDLLLKAAEKSNSTIRIAGGYVRDKLLGIESQDMDIAVDNMSGAAFVKFVQKELGGGKIAIIEAKPEQSKHLETAQINIFGLSIDFTNLRKETYSDTRIPTIEPGTPKEDAFRRDLTINALFYNINTKKIEDFTGMGLDDLKNKIAKTPLDPIQTFLDDPLRILRTIRFCAKYKFCPHTDIFLSLFNNSEIIKKAFKEKISKERILIEMIGHAESNGWKCGFLNGPNPHFALILLNGFGFRDIVFDTAAELMPWDMDQNNSHHDLSVWDHTMLALGHLNMRMTRKNPEEDAIRNLALILHDLGKRDPNFQQKHSDGIHTQYKRHEERSAELAEEVLTNLKVPTNMKKRIVHLVAEHMRFHWLEDNAKHKPLRKIINDLGEDWENLLDISISDAYGKDSAWDDPSVGERYEKFREKIKVLLTEQKGATKPIRPISGLDVMQKLGLKQGPDVGLFLSELDDQLLENPNMTKEEALVFLDNLYKERTNSLNDWINFKVQDQG